MVIIYNNINLLSRPLGEGSLRRPSSIFLKLIARIRIPGNPYKKIKKNIFLHFLLKIMNFCIMIIIVRMETYAWRV